MLVPDLESWLGPTRHGLGVITLDLNVETMVTAMRLAGGDRTRVRIDSATEVLVVNGCRP